MPPPPPSPPQQSNNDNSLAPMWITILLFLTCGLIWYLAHAYIVAFIFQIKLLQAELVSLFTSGLDSTIALIKNSNPASVSFKDMSAISARVGEFTRYPIMVLLVILGVLLFFNDINVRYRKTYSMQTLADAEKENWPHIKPVLKLDLKSQDIDEGPWAMGITPMQFAKKHQLLREEPTPITEPTLRRKIRPTVSVIENKAKQIFVLQLGRYWEGIESLTPHTKALFAIFAARINRDRDGAYALMKQISNSAEIGKLDFTGSDVLLKKHFNTKGVQKILANHAFLLTIMASMLEKARTDGVIATAEFLWLKPIDRPLWYMLNNIGRQTAWIEVAGPFAHWITEKEFGYKIMVPMVETAVTALDIAIKEIIYTPSDER